MPLSRSEFIALMATLFATIAFSIDAMLPAMAEIADELSPQDPNRVQLIITVFVLGTGIGTLFSGPLSDAFGRKPVVLAGIALFTAGAALAWAAPTLELVLAARLIQGFGAAGPRVVCVAIVRDQFAGRQMAQIMSFIFLIFSLIPAFAPSLGAIIIYFAGWRSIFLAFIGFALLSAFWFASRQPETLPKDRRRSLRSGELLSAIREVLSHRTVRLTVLVQSLSFACLFSLLSSIQQVFDQTYGKSATFPLWFMAIACIASTSSLINARLVIRLGMRRIVRSALLAQAGTVLCFLLFIQMETPQNTLFLLFFLWASSVFFMIGLTIGNLNAIAMEPLGHIAGTAASVVGSVSTVLSVGLAVPLALQFNGTPVPLALGILGFVTVGYALMRVLGSRGEAQPA